MQFLNSGNYGLQKSKTSEAGDNLETLIGFHKINSYLLMFLE